MTLSNTYRFKIQDVSIIVSLDSSFYISPNENNLFLNINKKKDIHFHPQHEIFFIGDDPLIVFGESSSFQFNDCIVCIPSFFPHNSIRHNDYRILFSYSVSNAKKSEIIDFFNKMVSSSGPFTLKVNKQQYLYLNEISKYIHDSSPISNEIVSSLMKLLFLDMYNSNSTTVKNYVIPRRDSYFITIENIIHHNYNTDVNLGVVADALHLSTKQTSRIIRKHYKTSLSSLINQKRLMAACTLLESSDMSISDIVENVNFPSDSYFYAQFKKRFGCTPLKYRKKYQSTKNQNF